MRPQYICDKARTEEVETAFDGNKDTSSADTGGEWGLDKDVGALLSLMISIGPALLLLFSQ